LRSIQAWYLTGDLTPNPLGTISAFLSLRAD